MAGKAHCAREVQYFHMLWPSPSLRASPSPLACDLWRCSPPPQNILCWKFEYKHPNTLFTVSTGWFKKVWYHLGKASFYSLLEMPACHAGNKEYFCITARQRRRDIHITHMREFNAHILVPYNQKNCKDKPALWWLIYTATWILNTQDCC